MRYLGKVFTGILNNRLASLSDEIGLLSSAPAGFRNAHSTADNIFILHSLINVYLSTKKKLFCTFIDFSRALNTIWRVGLWQTLIYLENVLMFVSKCKVLCFQKWPKIRLFCL